MKKIVVGVMLCLLVYIASGQENSETVNLIFNPYTSLRTHYALLESESEFQDNASRIGFNIRLGKSPDLQFIGQVELSIRLIESSISLNADSRTTSGFIVLNQSQENQVFAARLGYLGVDMGAYGVITIGKQWSTYYDITGWTDRFNVFGGTASNTYVAGTDGSIGTGRSDQALIYRLNPGRWHFGLQVLAGSTGNNSFFDGYGGVVHYEFFPGFSAGGAYQRAVLANSLIAGTLGLEADPEYYCAGIRYDKDDLYLSAVYARQSNGDLTVGLLNEVERPSVVYNDEGLELAGSYRWEQWRFLAGANLEWVVTEGLPLDADFHRENYIFGLEYHPNKLAYVYAEYRLDEGVNSFGASSGDVFTLGLRIDLSHRMEKVLRFKS